jgi:hypothetical protein
MVEHALIDGDIVNYRCAAVTENDDVNIACWQAGEMIQRIIHETNSLAYTVFLSGSSNFRYDIYPEYKANRKDAPRPKHWAAIREYLCTYHNARVTDGHEADDAMGIHQCLSNGDTIICSIDKDMLMIPGMHYNFVKQELRMVSPLEGMRHFYKQLILGDKTDNIFGYDGKARDKVPNFLKPAMAALDEMTDEFDMYDFVKDMYDDEDRFHMNAQCLWIWRKEEDIWCPPGERMERSKTESIHNFSFESGEPTLPPEV